MKTRSKASQEVTDRVLRNIKKYFEKWESNTKDQKVSEPMRTYQEECGCI